MGIFEGILLCSDYDDTLCDARGDIPARNLEALEYFEREGGRFTVATGRAKRTFAPCARQVPLNAPAILSNGSALYDFARGRMLRQTFLPQCAAEDFALLCRHCPDIGFEAYHGEDIYAYRPNWVTHAHMAKVGTDFTRCARVEDMPLPWTKAIIQQEYPALLRARDFLQSRFPGRYEAIFSNRYYLEVTERGSSKGGMARYLARLLSIRPEHLYCVGDNENDLPMLAQSAIPFAPGDCAQVVRDSGARLLCPCRDGVMGDIVEILEKRYRKGR